ncbi:MAG: peptidoglycan DD-metalloendopeptidase family protein [Caldiserica bacterium]|jgi:murein DD-endopeptidase MepM/ murein hydrolase activator NlpD|nr:peptidoglycan DD-metalloendopeptidase family protein [Caldisericota bacterium]
MRRLIICLLIAFQLIVIFGLPVRGNDLEDLKSELEAYKARLEEVRQRLEEVQSHQSDILNQLDEINRQMYDLEAEYTFYQTKLVQVSDTIEQASQSIAKKDAEVKVIEKALKERQDLIMQRIVALYRLNRGRYLEIIFSSEDFQQFRNRIAYFQRVFKEDQALLEQTKQLIGQLNIDKKQLEEQKALLLRQQEQYALLKQKAEEEQKKLEDEYFNKKADLVSLALEQSQLEGEESELVQAIEEDQAYIERLLATTTYVYTGEPSEAGLIWPVSGNITSYFGYRSWGDFHRGIDIGAAYGTPVAAAADGIVVAAEYRGTYGNMILIAHAGGISTVYAHLSGFAVGPGDTVSQGEVIGWVGMTGLTTGPHLHFEVRVGGEFVDPLEWLP